ncbi:integrin alpha-7 [Columba livia]|uniref:Integrin alpha-7 n=2 Tax=Columba livia TaxID=8932 RepID=A0A2I0LJC3_COLLI|nr:integrin alpha-7 [Columba livia]
MSDQKDVALEIHVTNLPSDPAEPQRDGDDAHEALLIVTFPPELPYSALRPYDGRAAWVGAVASVFGTEGRGQSWGAEEWRWCWGVGVRSAGDEGQGWCWGCWEGGMRSDLGVSHRGPSLKTLGSAFLTLLWPHELRSGKWLLYPLHMELAAPPGRGVPCSPPANPLGLALEPPEAAPPEVPESGSWWVPAPAERRRNVTLDCAQGTARCLSFRCPLPSFERAAVLTARGRLWNGTFLEEYLAVTSVELIVRASVSVTSSIKNLVLKDAAIQIPVTIYLDPGAAVAGGGVPWWVIVLAALAGGLVLALLVCVLWKLGFFRRARAAPPAVPQFHAVRIPREQRQHLREGKLGTIQRKEWAALDLGRWKPADDLLLINAVLQTNDLTSVHQGVKFSCRFNLREIQERWYALLYDPVISKLACQAMRQLHPEAIAAIQSKVLFSKAEEQLLTKVGSSSQPTLDTFQELLHKHPDVFYPSRTAKALQLHWQLMKQYYLLDDQTGEPPGGLCPSVLPAVCLSGHPVSSHPAGMSSPDFDSQTLAVLRGRMVRYLMRSREVSAGVVPPLLSDTPNFPGTSGAGAAALVELGGGSSAGAGTAVPAVGSEPRAPHPGRVCITENNLSVTDSISRGNECT